MGAVFSSFHRKQSVAESLSVARVKLFPYISRDWRGFSLAASPTPSEVTAMLGDMRRRLNSWIAVYCFLGIQGTIVQQWLSGRRSPSDSSARLVWLSWWLICRPGLELTYFDICCNGRTTRLGNPATAGRPFPRRVKVEPQAGDVAPDEEEE